MFGTEKHLTQTAACVTTEPFAGAKLTGYEIHAGRTEVWGSAFCILADGTPEGCVQDSVFGTYLHGLFDTGELTEKLTAFCANGRASIRPGPSLSPWSSTVSSSLICLPMVCARHWICPPSMPPWECKRRQHMTPQHHLPADIERTSISIITRELDELGLTPPPETAAVVKRVIHTTADFDYAKNLRFTPGAVEAAVKALHAGAFIVTDTNMALAGITKPGLKN